MIVFWSVERPLELKRQRCLLQSAMPALHTAARVRPVGSERAPGEHPAATCWGEGCCSNMFVRNTSENALHGVQFTLVKKGMKTC
eukprot:6482199-Pyramimonas_sp.AAC.1